MLRLAERLYERCQRAAAAALIAAVITIVLALVITVIVLNFKNEYGGDSLKTIALKTLVKKRKKILG